MKLDLALLCLVPGVIAARSDGQSAGEPSRPHIVCFVADDFGATHAGCFGDAVARTPNIDRLAREGTSFRRAFAGSPTCAPSRTILYTGLMSARTGAHPNHWHASSDTRSIGHHLRECGYHVAVFNKVHVGPADCFPFERVKAGRKQDGGGGRCIDAARLDTWLTRQLAAKPGQPLCLFLCDNNTHLIWPDVQHPASERIVIPPYLPNTAATRASMARYYSEVELLDRRLGECLAVLEKHRILDDSLFVFTADQGPAWLHAKWNLYDQGIRVPLIARWPGRVRAGATSDAMLSLADVTPTFVEVAGGTPPPEKLDGRSFLPSLLDPGRAHRDAVFATHTGDGTMNNYPARAVRTGRYKLIWNLRSDLSCESHLTKAAGTDRATLWRQWQAVRADNPQVDRAMRGYQRRPALELYDVLADPDEMVNLADRSEHRATRDRLHATLTAWMDEQGDRRRDMRAFLAERPRRRRPRSRAPGPRARAAGSAPGSAPAGRACSGRATARTGRP